MLLTCIERFRLDILELLGQHFISSLACYICLFFAKYLRYLKRVEIANMMAFLMAAPAFIIWAFNSLVFIMFFPHNLITIQNILFELRSFSFFDKKNF